MEAWEAQRRRAKTNIEEVEVNSSRRRWHRAPGLQQEATSAYDMLMEANQAPSLSGSAQSPYDYDWPDDDRISLSRLEEEGKMP